VYHVGRVEEVDDAGRIVVRLVVGSDSDITRAPAGGVLISGTVNTGP